mgnify:CR=1 FL=1
MLALLRPRSASRDLSTNSLAAAAVAGGRLRPVVAGQVQMLGFDHLEQILERVSKSSGDGYPPYNVLQTDGDRLRISLAWLINPQRESVMPE